MCDAEGSDRCKESEEMMVGWCVRSSRVDRHIKLRGAVHISRKSKSVSVERDCCFCCSAVASAAVAPLCDCDCCSTAAHFMAKPFRRSSLLSPLFREFVPFFKPRFSGTLHKDKKALSNHSSCQLSQAQNKIGEIRRQPDIHANCGYQSRRFVYSDSIT